MSQEPSQPNRQEPAPLPVHATLPIGYRQGIITAITVVLGFTLLFLRYWGFELPGAWTFGAVLAAVLLILALLLQFVALWRSLLLSDDEVTEYKKTLRLFFFSVIVLLVSLGIAGMDNAHAALR